MSIIAKYPTWNRIQWLSMGPSNRSATTSRLVFVLSRTGWGSIPWTAQLSECCPGPPGLWLANSGEIFNQHRGARDRRFVWCSVSLTFEVSVSMCLFFRRGYTEHAQPLVKARSSNNVPVPPPAEEEYIHGVWYHKAAPLQVSAQSYIAWIYSHRPRVSVSKFLPVIIK